MTLNTCWRSTSHSSLLAQWLKKAAEISTTSHSVSTEWHHGHQSTQPPTLSTMKSIPSAISGSRGPDAKFPRTIFFSIKAGISQKLKQKSDRCNNIFKHQWLNIMMLYCKCFLSLHRPCVLTSNSILEETSSYMVKGYFKHGEQHSSCSKCFY